MNNTILNDEFSTEALHYVRNRLCENCTLASDDLKLRHLLNTIYLQKINNTKSTIIIFKWLNDSLIKGDALNNLFKEKCNSDIDALVYGMTGILKVLKSNDKQKIALINDAPFTSIAYMCKQYTVLVPKKLEKSDKELTQELLELL